MKFPEAPDAKQDRTLAKLAERLFSEWIAWSEEGVPDGPSLLIFNSAAHLPNFTAFGAVRNPLALRMAAQPSGHEVVMGSSLVARSSSASLPFQASTFGSVMLFHVVSKGLEPELVEASRLLRPDGKLFILGLNRIGMRYMGGKKATGLPGIRPLALRERLENLEMQLQGLLAAGFLRTEWPPQMNQGFSRMLVPLADLFLIVAGPADMEIINPLPKRRLRTVGSSLSVAGR